MKKKMMCIIFFIMLTLLTACAEKDVIDHNYTFEGENEEWSANFKVTGKTIFTRTDGILASKTESNEVLTVTYRGELSDLSTIKHLEISYKTSAGGGSISNNYNEDEIITNKTFTLKSGGKNGAIINEDEVIEVTVDIDGNKQIVELQ
ncbi:MAG: hypothetical protein K0S04_1005 [Herbinix sp.]|nr:hypothetical protein [Herbinix sp.]